MPAFYYSDSTVQTASTATSTVWYQWATTASVTTSTTETVWTYWTDSTTAGTTIWPTAPTRSAAEIAAERERMLAEAAQREERRRQAEDKAEALLIANLNDAQRESYRLHRMFEVVGLSGQLYRIRRGRVANIDVVYNGHVSHRLCAHPAENVPDQDTMLAQMLMLRFAEDEFVRTANRHH